MASLTQPELRPRPGEAPASVKKRGEMDQIFSVMILVASLSLFFPRALFSGRL